MIRTLLLFVGLIILLGVVIAVGLPLLEGGEQEAYGSLEGRFDQDHVTYEGVEYAPRTGLSSFLILGVDTREAGNAGYSSPYRSGGQSDFLLLAVIDDHAKKVHRIQIDRDTMAEITVLGVLGNELGTSTHQICLSHGFGDGREQSSRYTVQAVERLLNGIHIDGYYAMNLDGIPTFNDLLGGVTVTIEDDFSEFDPTMVPGATITLQGDQVELFVRSRITIGDGTNFSRMGRQRQFLNNAIDLAFQRVEENNGFINTLLSEMEPYVISDISRGRLINEVNQAARYTVEPTTELPGEYAMGKDGFVEFHADEAAVRQLVLGLFYEPVE